MRLGRDITRFRKATLRQHCVLFLPDNKTEDMKNA